MAESVRENLAATARKYAVRFYSVCKPVEFQDPLSKSLSHSERIVSGQSSHQQPKSGDNAAFNIDYSQRLGAFEVQVAVRTKKDFICHLLFSKLFKGNWPKMSTLQSLLERVLTEAKFFQLVKDPPRSPSRPTSRPGSPKREPLYKPPKKDNKLPEIHAEFDLRLPAADTDEEKDERVEEEEEEEPGEYDEDTYSLPLSRESSTRLLTIPENSDIDTAPKLGSPISTSRGSTKSAKSPKGKSSSAKYSAEENAAASALTRFMRASKPNESAPSSKRSSFSSEYSEDETSSGTASPIRSTKAKLMALGSASAGLQYVRRKSKNLDQAEGAGLISYEEAMAIANGTSIAEKPKLYTKKQSAIGILSRQNAGAGGQGRYLVVEDEDESPMQSDQPVRAFFPSPIQIQKTNSQTSIPFTAQSSPREQAALPLTPKRSTPHKKSSFSTVSEDDEVIGFSPRNSHKSNVSSIRPVVLAVEVSQAGMAFAKNRSSSVTNMPQTPTMVEMLHERQSTGKLSQSERIQGRPSPATRNPHNTHPSLEMRTKLNIGTLSRQNAGIRGESLVVADSDSEDESRPGDKPESVPSQRILNAMASAVSAVSLAETLTNTNAGTSTASSSTNTLALTGGSVTTPHSTPVVATTTATAVPVSSSLADRRPSNITAIDTSHSAALWSGTELKKDAPDPEVSITTAPAAASTVAVKATQPTTAAPAPAAAVPVIAASSTLIPTVVPTVVPTAAAPVPTVTAAVMTPMPSTTASVTAVPTPVVSSTKSLPHKDKAAAAPPSEPEPAPALTPVPARVVSAFAVQDNGTHMGRRMSSAEVLQMKRGLADQLVLTVSRDILEPVPSEYADDFDDFENFSPSKKAGNGLDDLFEASDFKLDDEL